MDADVVLIALADISRDARTLNLARALAKARMSTVVVGSTSASLAHESFRFLEWKDPGGSAFARWRSLHHFCRHIDVRSRVVAAMDLFALRGATLIKAPGTRHPALIFDAREFYFSLGPLQGRGWKQRVISAYERWMMRKVDRVMVSGELDADIIQQRFRLKERPHVLLNTPPYRDPVVSTVLREHFSIPTTHIVVIYQGVVHHGRGIAPFLKAMTLMDDVHLCIVGEGPAVAELQRTAEANGVQDRLHWYGAVPYDALHEITCSADIGLCLIEPVSMSYEYALPNKLFEYMTARIPTVVTDLPALREQVKQTPVGMMVPRSLEPLRIKDAVDQLRIDATYQAMKHACGAIRSLSYESQVNRAIDLFRELP